MDHQFMPDATGCDVPDASRRNPFEICERHRDPRSRAVVAVTQQKLGTIELELECGHRLRRRVAFGLPVRAICLECGAAKR